MLLSTKIHNKPNNLKNLILILALTLHPNVSFAAWSGISLDIGDETIPVKLNHQTVNLTLSTIALTVEEKTSDGLKVGAKIGQSSVKIHSETIDVGVGRLGLYLSFPHKINSHITFVNNLSIERLSTESDENGALEWINKEISLGFAFRYKAIRVTPTINFRSSKIDFYKDLQILNFKQANTQFKRYHFDYFVDKYSFIRLSFSEHSDATFLLSFTTAY